MKQILLLTFFQEFIRVSVKGKRLAASGKRLTIGTLKQYQIVLQYLQGLRNIVERL